MKGLELAEAFFNQFGLPALKQHFPDLAERAAAGLLGKGSEILGADDQHSRDHGWGPRFRLFIGEHDHERYGKEIQAKLNELKPAESHGISLARHRTQPIFVSTVDHFFRYLTGSPLPPQNAREWVSADENALFFAQAGKVFYDPVGQLTERHQAFADAYYPEDVWLGRVAFRLFLLWHYGDYNLRGRIARRADCITAQIAQGYFAEAAMQLAFLLNRRFAPYWKWLHWAFLRLPHLAGELEVMLRDLQSSTDLAASALIIGDICEFYRAALRDHDIFPDAGWRNFMGAFEIVDHKIRDPKTRRLVTDYFAPFL